MIKHNAISTLALHPGQINSYTTKDSFNFEGLSLVLQNNSSFVTSYNRQHIQLGDLFCN